MAMKDDWQPEPCGQLSGNDATLRAGEGSPRSRPISRDSVYLFAGPARNGDMVAMADQAAQMSMADGLARSDAQPQEAWALGCGAHVTQ